MFRLRSRLLTAAALLGTAALSLLAPRPAFAQQAHTLSISDQREFGGIVVGGPLGWVMIDVLQYSASPITSWSVSYREWTTINHQPDSFTDNSQNDIADFMLKAGDYNVSGESYGASIETALIPGNNRHGSVFYAPFIKASFTDGKTDPPVSAGIYVYTY